MRTSNRPARAARTTAARRAQLLAEFDRSGLSAAAFARRHGLHYTTFCGWTRERRLRTIKDEKSAPLSRVWRHQRAKLKPTPAFVQVELTAPTNADALIVELGGQARLRIESASQIALAAPLLQHLHAARPC